MFRGTKTEKRISPRQVHLVFCSQVRRIFRMVRRGWKAVETPSGWYDVIRGPRPPFHQWPLATSTQWRPRQPQVHSGVGIPAPSLSQDEVFPPRREEMVSSWVECTFIQNRFHPLTLSSKHDFIQWHFHPKHFHPILTLSSNDTFNQDSFIQQQFHPMNFSPSDIFIQ